jgi:hypothetical protein
MDPRTNRIRRTRQISNYSPFLSRRRSRHVLESDVGEIYARRVSCTFSLIEIEVALVEDDGIIGVVDVDVFICDVVDAAVADVLSCPGFEAGSVLECS